MIIENIQNKTLNRKFDESSLSDTTKILEISNFIDEWEQTVLFSPNGFYTIMEKNVIGKTQPLIETLEKDIDKIFEETVFDAAESKLKAQEIKSVKIRNIRKKMEEYENLQKLNWEIETANQTIEAAKTKAAAYKNYPETIEKCYLNALNAIAIKARLKQSDKKELTSMINEFNSDFFEKITKSFVDENSIEAEKFYLQNKSYILEEKRKELENSILHLKNRLEAFRKAQDFLFCDLKKSEIYEKISKIKNEEIREYTKLYYDDFLNSKENTKRKEAEEKSRKNWKLIDECLNNNSDLALLKTDLTLGERERNAQIEYIKSMIKQGKIETDNKKFFELYKTAFEETQKFEAINLYEFRHLLSIEDFEFFMKLREEIKSETFLALKCEYNEIKQYFDEENTDFNVTLIKLCKREKQIEEKNTKKEISLSQIAQLTESLAIRIKKWDSKF